MMLWLILVAAASDVRPATSQSAPAAVVSEARATVRVLHAVKIDFDSPSTKDLPPAHESSVVSNGTRQRVRLIEFE